MKLQELNPAELRNINGGGLLDGLLGGGRNDRNNSNSGDHNDDNNSGGLLDGLLGDNLLGGLLDL